MTPIQFNIVYDLYQFALQASMFQKQLKNWNKKNSSKSKLKILQWKSKKKDVKLIRAFYELKEKTISRKACSK